MRKAVFAARVALVLVIAGTLSGCSYNKFTTQEEAIKGAWAEVQNQLQRRNDLIPNLVETVKGYAAHEEGIFKEIADARSRLLAAKSPEETIQRMRYNEKIQEDNAATRRFPGNVTAKMFGFKQYPYFEAPASAQALPKVDFKK